MSIRKRIGFQVLEEESRFYACVCALKTNEIRGEHSEHGRAVVHLNSEDECTKDGALNVIGRTCRSLSVISKQNNSSWSAWATSAGVTFIVRSSCPICTSALCQAGPFVCLFANWSKKKVLCRTIEYGSVEMWTEVDRHAGKEGRQGKKPGEKDREGDRKKRQKKNMDSASSSLCNELSNGFQQSRNEWWRRNAEQIRNIFGMWAL